MFGLYCHIRKNQYPPNTAADMHLLLVPTRTGPDTPDLLLEGGKVGEDRALRGDKRTELDDSGLVVCVRVCV